MEIKKKDVKLAVLAIKKSIIWMIFSIIQKSFFDVNCSKTHTKNGKKPKEIEFISTKKLQFSFLSKERRRRRRVSFRKLWKKILRFNNQELSFFYKKTSIQHFLISLFKTIISLYNVIIDTIFLTSKIWSHLHQPPMTIISFHFIFIFFRFFFWK